MPKKIVKKVNKKLRTVEVPQPTYNGKQKADSAIASLESLQASSGWAIIVGILKDNIAYLEKCIIDKKDPVSNEFLDGEEIELARTKRSLNNDLLNTPKNYIEELNKAEAVPEDFDPYYKTNQEIERDKRGAVRDDGR